VTSFDLADKALLALGSTPKSSPMRLKNFHVCCPFFAKTYYILQKHSYLAKGFGKMDLVVALWNGEPTTKFHVFWVLCSKKKKSAMGITRMQTLNPNSNS
jgi:hypothetical protein